MKAIHLIPCIVNFYLAFEFFKVGRNKSWDLKLVRINLMNVKKKSKEYGIWLYSPCRRCWSPFRGPKARKHNEGLGPNHPVLSHTLPVYLPQIFTGTNLELSRLWLDLQSYTTDPNSKPNNQQHQDSNPCPRVAHWWMRFKKLVWNS